MKSSKIKEYVNMSVEDLQKESKELKKELFKLRFQHAMNGLDNPKKITLIKKDIARVNTVITKKSIEASK
ncbi:50S ribosomal protein L29 [compost metagenome]